MNLRKIVLLFLAFCVCTVKCQQNLILECDEIDSEDYYDIDKPFCTISNFKVNHNQNVKIRNYSGWVAGSIKFMKFYESSLLYIPFKLFEEFPQLQTLDASATQILELTRNTFSSAGNLTYLNLAGNELTKIGTSVFVGANSLLRLDLCNNKLEELSEFCFNGLKHLNSIMLCGNQLQEIPSSLFKDNHFLNVVRLENNLLENIGAEVFNDLFLLHEVNLVGNKLRTIDPNTFDRSYSLDDLFLSTNRFTKFSLSNKSIMRHLEINGNNLTSISINGTKFVHAENNHISTIHMINSLFLESLFLAHNNISDIRNITKAPGLLELSLSHNKIGQLNITTFDNLKRLRKLILRNIGLKYITFGMFSKQVHLEVLDLSFNNLTTLNLDIFVPYMINLVNFYVDGNNLTEIQGKHSFAMAFQNLSTLGISQNQFNCSYLHSILISPYLQSTVTLHIEPDSNNEESSHIRDIPCSSNITQSLQEVKGELNYVSGLYDLMQQSLKTQHANEQKLALHLLLMKVALWLLISVVGGIGIMQYMRHRRKNYILRRNNSIVFNSEATISTVNHMDH